MDLEKFYELWENDELESVYEELDDSWRHGNYVYTVFKYLNEETNSIEYYGVNYQVSGDGNYHSIRDRELWDDSITRVNL